MSYHLIQIALSRHLRQHPWQLALAVLGISLGVAVVLAVDLANTSARKSFQLASEQLTGRATHRIVSSSGFVPEQIYVRLRTELGISQSAPVLMAYVSANNGQQYQLLGIDPFAEAQFRDYLNGSENAESSFDLIQLITQPNTALLPVPYQELTLEGNENPQLHAVGMLTDPAFSNFIVCDLATAQTVLNRLGELSYIDLILDQPLIARIEAQLPPDLQLETAAASAQTTLNMSASFHLNLTAMSLLALLVGVFLIYNTMNFAVVQRRQLLGMLRALGVSRRELFTAILLESVLLGLVGTLLGTLLGIWLGSLLVELVSRTVNDLYYALSASQYFITPWSLAKGFALGLLASVLAAILPAREAAAAPAGVTLSRALLEARWQSGLPRQISTALGLLLAGGGILYFTTGLVGGFAGLFVTMLGFALLTPALLVLMVKCLRPGFNHLLATMALTGISRHLSRTGVALAALVIAFAATVGVAVMVDSFRSGVVIWLKDVLSADVYIAPVDMGAGARRELAPAVIRYLQTQPKLTGLTLYRGREILYQQQPIDLLALAAAPQTWAGYRFAAGQPENAQQAFQAGQGVIITEPLAYRQDLALGSDLSLATPAGLLTRPVIGIIYDYGSEHGRILLDLALYRQYWQDEGISSVAVYSDQPQRLLDKLPQQLKPLQELQYRQSQVLFERSLEIFDRTFTITNVLRLLAIVVACLGMLSALMALMLERSRELAVLRALGMTAQQIDGLLILQTALMGLIAGIIAIPVGLWLAVVLIEVINRRAFGWSLPFEVDPLILLQTVILSVGAALLAVIYPLWRQRRVQIAGELRDE